MSDFEDVRSVMRDQRHKAEEAKLEKQKKNAERLVTAELRKKDEVRRKRAIQSLENQYWSSVGQYAPVVWKALDDYGNAVWNDGKRRFLMPSAESDNLVGGAPSVAGMG